MMIYDRDSTKYLGATSRKRAYNIAYGSYDGDMFVDNGVVGKPTVYIGHPCQGTYLFLRALIR